MIPVSIAEKMEAIRWTPDPETVATLRFVIHTLTSPESDGLSMLERVYLNCRYENQRCEEIQTAGFAIVGNRFKGKSVFFQADLPDDGRCRFQLRIADHPAEVKDAQPAKEDYFINLLRPRDEWVTGPAVAKPELVLTKPAPKSDSQTRAKPRLPAKGRG